MSRESQSIVITHPEMAKLWHPTKNNDLDIDTITSGSGKTVWWLGECGHEWRLAPIGQRSKKIACSYCSGRAALSGFNDLKTTNPHLIPEWSPNNTQAMNSYLPTSAKKALWVCLEGHGEYLKEIRERVEKSRGCPVCSNTKVVAPFNDLESNFPDLMEQFDYEKNTLSPSSIYHGNTKHKLWWLCKEGHSFQATAYNKTHKLYGTRTEGCSVCSGKVVISDINGLSATHPEIAKQWHPTKNLPKQVDEVYASSHSHSYWWVCDEGGHEWETTPRHRTLRQQGCPYCSGSLVVKNETDLPTLRPDLMEEWDWESNSDIDPTECGPGSCYTVGWICKEKSHTWTASIINRAKKHSGCPKCVAASQTSRGEQEVYEFVRAIYVGELTQHVKGISGVSHDVDIYLPASKLALEYNGVYWHSEERKDRDYHRIKFRTSQSNSVMLIQIWEDDWINHRGKVEASLKSLISPELFPSEDRLRVLTTEEDGVYVSDLYVKDHSEVITSWRFSPKASTLEILTAPVYYSFKDILSYIRSLFPNSITIKAELDNCWGLLRTYEKQGFKIGSETEEECTYLVKNMRRSYGEVYKSFQRSGMSDFTEYLSDNRIYRVWDAGKTVMRLRD